MGSYTTIIGGAPKIVNQEIDESTGYSVTSVSVNAAGFVVSNKGPVDAPVLCSSTSDISQFGTIDTTYGYGTVLAYQTVQGMPIYLIRVVNTDARYGLITLFNYSMDPSVSGSFLAANPNGTQNSYEEDDIVPYASYLSGTLGTVTEINFPWGTDNTYTETYNTDDATTFKAAISGLASAITEASTTTALTSSTALYNGGSAENGFVGAFWLGEGVPGEAIDPAQWTPSNTSSWTNEESWVVNFYAHNPGSWINDYGVSLSDIDTGTPDIFYLTFSDAIPAGADFTGTITVNNSNYNLDVAYTESSDATMQSICTAIETDIPGATAVLKVVNSQDADYRIIAVSSSESGPNTLSFSNLKVSLPSSSTETAPTIVISQFQVGTEGDGTFIVNVWSTSNLTTPVEQFKCSLKKSLDGFGYQTFIEDVINSGSNGTKSSYIRAVVNPLMPDNTVISTALAGTISWFTGGADGSIPTDNQIATALEVYKDTDNYDIMFLPSFGYTSSTILAELNDIRVSRLDCVPIIDVPSASQAAADVVTWRAGDGAVFNDSYSAIFTPDVYLPVAAEGINVYVPPSGSVLRTIGYSISNYNIWKAAAGTTRGILQDVVGLRELYGSTDRDSIADVNVNCSKKLRNGTGYAIWDVKTTQSTQSLLSFLPVRVLFLYIERIIDIVMEDFQFDNITPNDMYNAKQAVSAPLQDLLNAEAIAGFYVLASTANNPQSTTNLGQFNISVYVTPYAVDRTILVDTICTADTTVYSELITNGIM